VHRAREESCGVGGWGAPVYGTERDENVWAKRGSGSNRSPGSVCLCGPGRRTQRVRGAGCGSKGPPTFGPVRRQRPGHDDGDGPVRDTRRSLLLLHEHDEAATGLQQQCCQRPLAATRRPGPSQPMTQDCDCAATRRYVDSGESETTASRQTTDVSWPAVVTLIGYTGS
jgi:hypothetical protein